MTTETWVLRDHLLELADVLAVVLEDHLRDDQAEIIDIVRLRIIWVESQMYRRQGIRPRAPNKSPRSPLSCGSECAWMLSPIPS